MKIVGVSFGTKNGNNDTMCKAALLAAKEAGAEVEFIHLPDWDIQYCTGCVACSRGLVMGKGNICTRRDDFDAFRSILLDADGILFVSPIFESGASGLLHTVCDRFGPRMDRGMNIIGDKISKEMGGPGVDPRLLQDKVISFVGIGGSDWACRVQTDHAMVAMSPGWKVIDNDFFSWSKDVIMHDDKIARMEQIGRNLAEAARDIEKAHYMGEPGVCPHCQCSNFWLVPGTTKAVCELCGLEGEISAEGGAWKFTFRAEDEHKAHDTISGKFLHADDIKENEGRLMNLGKDPEFVRRKSFYRDSIQPTPPPNKA